jgi:hypothetical protein
MIKNAKWILIFSICFGSCFLYAQSQRLSLFASYNQATVDFSFEGFSQYFTTNNSPHTSMNYGVLLEKELQSFWSVESGLIYLTRGFQSPVTPSSFTKRDYNEYSWSGLYLPIEGRFRPTKVFTGFIGGYYFQGVGQITFLSSTSQTSSKVKFEDQGFQTKDWGLTYGAGINFQTNSQTEILIEIRFNEGLANVVDTSNQNVGTGTKATNKDTMISIGIVI